MVLEVGPGLGSLTLALLESVGRVVAVEIDPVLARQLPETVAERAPDRADRLQVVTADALRVTELPASPTALVANLPYNVSVPVLLHLLAAFPSIERALVMVQLEVAQRLAAPPGSRVYGVPSAKARWYADVRQAGPVGRSVFWPVPNVDFGPRRTGTNRSAAHRCGAGGRIRSDRRRVRPAPQDAALRVGGVGRKSCASGGAPRVGRGGSDRAR